MNSQGVTLSIESAIAGGSLAVIAGDEVLARWTGSNSVSKAEELLFTVDLLLTQNDLEASDIDLIAVSAGPGSFTGIRVGLATAMGLKAGLGIQMSSVSALHAIAVTQGPDGENVIPAVPVGRNAVCCQRLVVSGTSVSELGPPKTFRVEDLKADLDRERKARYLIHRSLSELIDYRSVELVDDCIAVPIGQLCRVRPDSMTEPLFVSKSF